MSVDEPEIARLRKLARDRANICAPLPAGRRPRERQYVLQCEDARRAVTVQQTACATNFAQEEEKV